MHPETEEGEVFIGNADNEDMAKIRWSSKRPGTVAYNIEGERIRDNSLFPVFVQISELPKEIAESLIAADEARKYPGSRAE